MYREGQVYEFFQQLATKGQGAVLAAVADSDTTIQAIQSCQGHDGLGRKFTEQAIRDTLLELSLADIPNLMALVQNTLGIMDMIAEHDSPDGGPSFAPAYGAPFPRPRR